jgi:hypothetical protein
MATDARSDEDHGEQDSAEQEHFIAHGDPQV